MKATAKEIKDYFTPESNFFLTMIAKGNLNELAEKRGVTAENKIKFNALLDDYIDILLEKEADRNSYETLVDLVAFSGSDDENEQKEALSMVARKTVYDCYGCY